MAKKSKNTVKINWDEEEGGKFIKNPGEYIVLPISVEQDEDDEGKSFLKWTFEVQEGKAKGATIGTRTYITPKALWKLRELLECMGFDVPQGSVQDLDLDEVVEEANKFVIEVEEGNERADGNGYYMQVSDYMSLADYDEATAKDKKKEEEDVEEDSEAEEEEPVSKNSKKSKKKDSKKSEDEEDLLDQMEEEIDELGLDIDLDDYDTFEDKKAAFEKAKRKAGKKASKEVEEDEDSEEEDEDEHHYTVDEIEALGTKQLKLIASEIGLELDEEASTRSKRRSVIAGLRKAGLLDE